MNNPYLLLHDLEGRSCLVPYDFMLAVRGEIEKDLTDEEKASKIVAIGSPRKKKVPCTVVFIHEQFNILIMETPEEIYEMLEAMDYEVEYEQESDEENPDPAESAKVGVQDVSSCV